MTNAKPIRRIAIIGTGVIGASWASLFLAKGLHVVATDPAPNAEASLRKFVETAWPALKRLGLYFNPIVLVNTRNFYAPLGAFMQQVIGERFMNPEHAAMWSLVDAPAQVLPAIRATPKWREDAREYAAVRSL